MFFFKNEEFKNNGNEMKQKSFWDLLFVPSVDVETVVIDFDWVVWCSPFDCVCGSEDAFDDVVVVDFFPTNLRGFAFSWVDVDWFTVVVSSDMVSMVENEIMFQKCEIAGLCELMQISEQEWMYW